MKRLTFALLASISAIAIASCGGRSSSSREESLSSKEESSLSSQEQSSETTSSAEPSSETPSSEEPSSQATSSEPSSEEPAPSSEQPSSEEPSSVEPSSSEEPSSSDESSSSSKTSSSKFAPPANLGIADGPILHCFNWTLSNIKSKLADIKDAGFRAVQISPMQPQKDPYPNNNWKNEWWKLYQPLGFHVAVDNENVLGTKSELVSLCKAADEAGIKVVMDVVANHLANGNSKGELNGAVNNHEPYIYAHQNETIHSFVECNDDAIRNVVQGNIGMPDLNTANAKVQERVISLLKEYLDCGVDGFRFDAAKHIETPDDGDYASSFWPNVLGATTDYATKKGLKTPYYYGEILYKCGANRQWTSYTKYMSIVDNEQGSATLEGVVSKNLGKVNEEYKTVQDGSKLVLWAESHDTYSNDSGSGYSITRGISEADINKTYVVQTSRQGASSLYLARPDGTMGSIGSTSFASDSVKAVNKFHTLFVGKKEAVSKTDGAFVNVRGEGEECGAVIVGVNSADKLSLTLDLADGKYVDLVSGSRYTIASKALDVTLHDGCAVLVPASAQIDPPSGDGPAIDFSCENPVFDNSTQVAITVDDAESATYTVDGKSPVPFDGEANVVLSPSAKGRIGITVNASNEFGTSAKTYYVYKTDAAMMDSSLILYNVPDNAYPYVWAWPSGGNGYWVNPIREEGLAGFSFSDKNYLVATLPANTSPDWGRVINKTSDRSLTAKLVDYSSLSI